MNIKITKYLFLLTISLLSLESFAQDVQFSQFYAVPLYQNPAFTGSAHRTRAILHQRLQWPRLDAKYITSLVSVDHYINNYKSGFGLSVLRDVQGGNTISSWDVTLSYAYEVQLSSSITFRPGLSAGFASRNIDYSKLRFPTQFNDIDGYQQGSASPLGQSTGENKMYPDIGAGGIFYGNKVWFGVAAHHLNLPNQSFVGQVARLPIKTSFTGGYKISFEEKRSAAYLEEGKEVTLTPTFHYKFQGKSDQLDLGLYGIYDVLMLGFWYRGIPIKEYNSGVQNNESIIFLVGYKVKSFSISYSYDVTVSRLAAASTGGSHEINLTYLHYKVNKKRKPMKRLPCPQFYKH